MEFKFKNNLPSNFLIGFSNASANLYSKGCFFHDNNTIKIWFDGFNQANLSTSITVDTVFKIKVTNTNHVEWYINDTIVASRDMGSSGFNTSLYLRVDDFASSLTLDYLKIL